MPSDASSGNGWPILITISEKALYSLDHTIKMIDNWLQIFCDSYKNIIAIYKNKISELFITFPNYFLLKKSMIINEIFQTIIRAVGGKWFLNKMGENSTPIKRR